MVLKTALLVLAASCKQAASHLLSAGTEAGTDLAHSAQIYLSISRSQFLSVSLCFCLFYFAMQFLSLFATDVTRCRAIAWLQSMPVLVTYPLDYINGQAWAAPITSVSRG